MNKIGVRIRKFREQRGLSQENIANALGISQPSYLRLEKEDERITITRIIEIAAILKTSVAELINERVDTITNQQNSENIQAYLDTIFHANKEHIQTLKEEITFLRNLMQSIS